MFIPAYATGGAVQTAKDIRDLGQAIWNYNQTKTQIEAAYAYARAHPGQVAQETLNAIKAWNDDVTQLQIEAHAAYLTGDYKAAWTATYALGEKSLGPALDVVTGVGAVKATGGAVAQAGKAALRTLSENRAAAAEMAALAQKIAEQRRLGNTPGAMADAEGGGATHFSPDPYNPKIVISKADVDHILYGDKYGGGHMWPGKPGKTSFPREWSADKILSEVSDIATHPKTEWYAQTGTGEMYTKSGSPARWVAYEVRSGVRIRVVFEPATNRLVSAFPDAAPMPKYPKIKR